LTLWPGHCPTHTRITREDILRLKCEYPEAKAIVHPECRPEVIDLADEVLSTGGMVRYARRDDVRIVIVGTEIGILHRLRKENPDVRFIPASEQAICPDMKLISLEKVLRSLEEMQPQVVVPELIRDKTVAAIGRMLAVRLGDDILNELDTHKLSSEWLRYVHW
jgi:quinolinate synthase